jgi:pyruvate dehydrogenase E2 component (dihydrolipoamide acetyltransferase)
LPPSSAAGVPPTLAAPANADETGAAIKAVPAARKLARELNVPLSAIQGAGPNGRITVDDVKRFASVTAPSSETWQPLSARRQALVAQMQKSLAEIPPFHVARQIEVAPLIAKKESTTFTARLAFCLGRVLAPHPALRTIFSDNKIRVAPVSVAIAMETPRGLVAPALRLTDLVDPAAAASALVRLRAQAAAGSLLAETVANAPFALSNLGMFGVDFFTPFVFHGQAAVLGVSRSAAAKAWFNLAVDHRVCDGVEAARFLEALQQEILAL